MLGATDTRRFIARVDRSYPDAFDPLARLYGEHTDVAELLDDLLGRALACAAVRSTELRHLDCDREVRPEWFLDESMIGYLCYADRFGDTLSALEDRIDYLEELGVTYLHVMPPLAPRDGSDDGGYAIADYRAVNPWLGDMDDLRHLAASLRQRGISLCIDLVVNHTAREHEWARKATAGELRYRDYYLIFEDRELPDAYERTLPEVLPDRAPGNFTWVDEIGGWVWTTFHEYQWDLDYTNPAVFAEVLEIMLDLANVGVEVFRLGAVPFLWKRMGTDCRDQPEAHLLLQAFRALVAIAAPAVLFGAEASGPPAELVEYLGANGLQRHECDLAHHNPLMVMLWSAVAARDARLPTHALGRMRTPPPTTTWVTFVRCHDDIGWAVTDRDAAAVGLDGFDHRSFLTEFYAGDFPGSFAHGDRFGSHPAPRDARTSGATASLAGIEQALERGDDVWLSAGVSRLLLLYATIYGWGGIPLIYMGDEIALRSDHSYLEDPNRADDGRWQHRPHMDWDAAARRRYPSTLEGRVFGGFRRLAAAREATAQLHGYGASTTPLYTDNPRVLAWVRRHPRFGSLLGVTNFDDQHQSVDADLCRQAVLGQPRDVLDMWPLDISHGQIHLQPLSVAWITDG